MAAIRTLTPLSRVDQSHQILALQRQIEELQNSITALKTAKCDGHFIKSGNISKFISISSVIMIEALSNYTYIYLLDGTKIFTAKTLKYWETRFANSTLIRIHKSYLVNKIHISCVCKATRIVTLQCNLTATYSRRLKNSIL